MQISTQRIDWSRAFKIEKLYADDTIPPDTAINRTTCPCCGTQVEAKIPIVDLQTNVASFGGLRTKMRPKEAEILSVMLCHHPGVALRENLMNAVWPRRWPEDPLGTLSVHITNLRTRLAGLGWRIRCVRNKGWKLEPASC